MVDDEMGGAQRLDDLGVLAPALRGVAHRGEIDDERDAGHVLEQHAGNDERHLFVRLAVGFQPASVFRCASVIFSPS